MCPEGKKNETGEIVGGNSKHMQFVARKTTAVFPLNQSSTRKYTWMTPVKREGWKCCTNRMLCSTTGCSFGLCGGQKCFYFMYVMFKSFIWRRWSHISLTRCDGHKLTIKSWEWEVLWGWSGVAGVCLVMWLRRLRYMMALHLKPLQPVLCGCEIKDAVKLMTVESEVDGFVSSLMHCVCFLTAPSTVSIMHQVSRTVDSITLSWSQPDQPNGVILDYELQYYEKVSVLQHHTLPPSPVCPINISFPFL